MRIVAALDQIASVAAVETPQLLVEVVSRGREPAGRDWARKHTEHDSLVADPRLVVGALPDLADPQ